MKFAVVAFLCLAVAESEIVVPRRSLGAVFEKFAAENGGAELFANINNDVQEFLNLLPKAQIKGIVSNYLQNDDEVKSNWEYATSDAVQQKVIAIEHSAEFKKVRAQLEGGGLDVARFINMFNDLFGYEHITREMRVGTGLPGMLSEIKATIPVARIKAWVAKKYIFSSAFRKMAKIIQSTEFKNNVAAVSNSDLSKELVADARDNGVDVDAIIDFISNLGRSYKRLELENYDY